MTVQAEPHRQGLHLLHLGHRADVPMATATIDARLYVHSVMKVDEVRQMMDASELKGAPAIEGLPHRGQQRAVLPDLPVAAHANGSARHRRHCALLRILMAV